MISGARVAALVLLLFSLPAAVLGARTVAIGDIHGAYDELVEILIASGLIDEKLTWSGGDSTLVQTGDFTDRGPGVREVMDLLMRLQREAAAAGGRVEVLMGNHEALNLVGELRDVSAEALGHFADESTTAKRDEEYKSMVRAARNRAKLLSLPRPAFGTSERELWSKANPEGTIAYLQQLLPEGKYGSWLRGLPAIVRVDNALFLHAGLTPEVGARPIEDINRQVHEEVANLDACRALLRGEGYLTLTSTTADLIQSGFATLNGLQVKQQNKGLSEIEVSQLETLSQCSNYEEWYLFAPEGPLWFRGYRDSVPEPGGEAGWSDEEGPALTDAVLAAQGTKHIVVGHNVQTDREIGVRFDGRIFLIDTGMLTSTYRGQASALEIQDGAFTAIYKNNRVPLWKESEEPPRQRLSLSASGAPAAAVATTTQPWSWAGADGAPLPFGSAEQLLEFLSTAAVKSGKRSKEGINQPIRVELERDGIRARAIFRDVDLEHRNKKIGDGKFYRHFRDSYAFDTAAYELDRILSLDRVPPTAPRSYKGAKGSIQAWLENAMTEGRRRSEGLRPPDIRDWSRQMGEVDVFDALINNHDRNPGNYLIDSEWKVWLIDHGRSFFSEHSEEAIAKLSRCERELWEKLRTADRGAVEERLEPYLRPAELKSLFDRWDAILQRFDDLIADLGAEAVIL